MGRLYRNGSKVLKEGNQILATATRVFTSWLVTSDISQTTTEYYWNGSLQSARLGYRSWENGEWVKYELLQITLVRRHVTGASRGASKWCWNLLVYPMTRRMPAEEICSQIANSTMELGGVDLSLFLPQAPDTERPWRRFLTITRSGEYLRPELCSAPS